MYQNLPENLDFLNALFNTFTEALLVSDPEGRILYANQPAALAFNLIEAESRLPAQLLQGLEQMISAGIPQQTSQFRLAGAPAGTLPVELEFHLLQYDSKQQLVLIKQKILAPCTELEAKAEDIHSELATVLDTIGDGVVAMDENCRIRLLNPAAEQLFGYSREEILGENVNRLLPAPERNLHDGYVKHYLETGERKIIGIGREVLGQHKSGRLIPLHLAIGEAHVKGSRLFVAILHNLTTRKQVEAQLSALSRVVEQTPNAVMISNLEGVVEYVNPSYCKLTGWKCDEIVNQQLDKLAIPESPESPPNRIRQSVLAGMDWREEIQCRKKNGQKYWALETISPMRDTTGKITHFLTIQQNITDQKRTLEALEISEERFRQVAEMSGEWLWEQDPQGRYIYSSAAVEQILGYKPEEILGQSYLNLMTEEDKLLWLEKSPPTQANQAAFIHLVNRYRHRSGREVFTESTGEPIFTEDGSLLKWRGVDHDITARKYYEEERRRTEAQRKELEIARHIQLSLLPKVPLRCKGVRMAGLCLPATHVGGDYFDYFYSGETLNVVIADVSGHSVGAALVMAGVRSALKAETRNAELMSNPLATSGILKTLNELLCEDLEGTDLFISMFYLRYNPRLKQLCFANAGHNPPLWWSEREGSLQYLDAEGLLLGINKNVEFEEKHIQLAEGDRLLLYTDGIPESQDITGEFFGMDRLRQLFNHRSTLAPEATIARILKELRSFCGGQNFQDDVSMVVLNAESGISD